MAFKFGTGFQFGPNTRPKLDTSGPDWFNAITRSAGMKTHGSVGDEAGQNYFTWDSESNPVDYSTGTIGTSRRLRKYTPGGFTNRVGSNTMDQAIQQFMAAMGGNYYQDADGNFYYEHSSGGSDENPAEGFYGLLTPEVAQGLTGQRQRAIQREEAGNKRRAAARAARGDTAGETRRLAEILGQQYAQGMMMPEWDRLALFSGRAGWNDPNNIALRQAVTSGLYNRWTSRMNPSAYNTQRPGYAPPWPANPGGGY